MSTPYAWPIRVYYEDTDVGGVVYYANYLRYMERARTEYLRDKGFEQQDLMAVEGIMFAVVHADVTFRRPARFDELIYATVAIEDATRVSVRFAQEIRRHTPDGELLVSAVIRGACLDVKTFQPRAIPQRILETST